MIAALIAACATVAACVAAMVWLVGIIRSDARDRADALVAAEKARGELAKGMSDAGYMAAQLADDLNRATRRADALEEWARGRVPGGVDNGTDLLLAELAIVAAGFETEREPAGGGAPAGPAVPDAKAVGSTSAAGGGDAARDDTLPGV